MNIADIPAALRRLASSTGRADQFTKLHGFRLNPVASSEEVAAFESYHGISLPREYREFLLSVGNGGAGPGCGVFPLGEFGRFGVGDLAAPFPHRETWNAPDEWFDSLPDPEEHLPDAPTSWRSIDELVEWRRAHPENEELAEKRMELEEWYYGIGQIPGTIPISDCGCAKCDRLVVTGAARGTVWHDARESDGGLLLYSGPLGEPLTFLGWYARWIKEHA
jgi:hypothetical protein